MGLFIPKKIRVGFSARHDTFTGKLAYIIYYDEKGKIRKEASFNSWRDEKLGILELDNEPRSGFVLNKGVQRDGYWGSGRSVVRVHDDRNFEFEISVTNLMGILMHSDVSKRDIVEQCVYAWSGTELVLLPCNSQEYIQAQEYTAKQDIKISAKDFKAGATYKGKKDEREYVYMGHIPWEGPDKKHVFWSIAWRQAEVKTADALILESESVHPNYDEFLKKTQKAQKADVQKMTPKLMVVGGVYYRKERAWSEKPLYDEPLVYMGQYDFLDNRVDSEHEVPHLSSDYYKKRPVFFNRKLKRFVSYNLSLIIVKINATPVSNFDALMAEFKRTCFTGPFSTYSQEPIQLQEDNLQPFWAVVSDTTDKLNYRTSVFAYYTVKKTEAGTYSVFPKHSLCLRWQGDVVYSDYWNNYYEPSERRYYGGTDYGKELKPKNNGNLTFEDLQALNPVEMYVVSSDGSKIKREALNSCILQDPTVDSKND